MAKNTAVNYKVPAGTGNQRTGYQRSLAAVLLGHHVVETSVPFSHHSSTDAAAAQIN